MYSFTLKVDGEKMKEDNMIHEFLQMTPISIDYRLARALILEAGNTKYNINLIESK